MSRTISRQESSTMHSPTAQTGGYNPTYRDPAAGYEPSASDRHKSLRIEPTSEIAYQQFQSPAQDTGSQQLNPYPQYPSRETPPSNRSSFYSQSSQPGSGYGPDYSYGNPRTDPSSAVASGVPQTGGWSGFSQPSRATGMQYPTREGSAQIPYGTITQSQFRQSSQYSQPVPLERQLPSSVLAQPDYSRSYGSIERQGSYVPGTGYAHAYDDRRVSYPQSQSYATAQDPFAQLPPRTLPAPSQQPGNLAPSVPAAQPIYPSSTIQQPPSTGAPTSSGGYPSSTQGYQYSQYPGQQGYW